MKRVERIARAYWQAEETRDPDRIMAFFTDTATWKGPGFAGTGRAEIRRFYQESADRFPELRVDVGRALGDDHEAAIEWSAVFTTADGGQRTLEGTNLFQVEGDRIASLTTYNDPASLADPAGEFTGKHVVITGAGSGIGAATARHFIAEGANVVGVDLNGGGLEQTGQSTKHPHRFTALVADVADPEVHRSIVKAAQGPHGEIDVLVNNAAVFRLESLNATEADWRATVDVNLIAPARLVAAAADALGRSGKGAVINLASISGHVAQSNRWTYNAAKGGILSLTRCQALDLAPRGIRVNSVSPGYIWTEVLDRSAGGDREKWEAIWGMYCPMLRCGEPSEVASAIVFLASQRASFITGNDLLVDGGLVSMSPDGQSSYQFSS